MFSKHRGVIVVILFVILITCFGVLFSLRNTPQETNTDINASFYPLGFFTEQLLGEPVNVIIPSGVDPHDYEPNPADLVALTEGKLLIYNGNSLEPWIDDFLETSEGESIATYKASDFVDSIEVSEDEHADEDEHDEEDEHGEFDPHFWLDPVVAQDLVVNLSEKLKEIYPSKSNEIDRNTEDFRSKLSRLDEEYRQGLSECTQDKIIVSHEAYNYLGARYKIELISISGISPEDEPSSKQMSEIANIASDENIKYIFFETSLSPDLAESIANETGAETLVLNPLETITNEEELQGMDYLSIMRSNLDNLRIAMECQ